MPRFVTGPLFGAALPANRAPVNLKQTGWVVKVGPPTLHAEVPASLVGRCTDTRSGGAFIEFDAGL